MANTDHPGSLVLYSSSATIQPSPDKSKWELAFTPSPGRTLNEMYSSCGKVLETRANRLAHQCGWGPISVAQNFQSMLGDGEERTSSLSRLQTDVPPKLERNVAKLIKYTRATESAKTQIQAFRAIVDLTTSFPGLRSLFLASRPMYGVSRTMEDISALWNRDGEHPPDGKWTFWRDFAAICLSDTAIAPIVEEQPIARLTNCVMDNGGLSVLERLIIAHDCETESIFTGALCVRYLAGILDLPDFWNDTDPVHSDVAKKLCLKLVQIGKDMGLDVPTLDILLESMEPSVDYDGTDLFADKILAGILTWLEKLESATQRLQPWYEHFWQVIQLLRGPRSAILLPTSFSRATSEEFEAVVPTILRVVELDIPVPVPKGTIGAMQAEDRSVDLIWDEEPALPNVLTKEERPDGTVGAMKTEDRSVNLICDEEPALPTANLSTKEERSNGARPVKLLLLGQRDVGKSTILNNFRLVHDAEAFHAERASWRPIIQASVVRSVQVILEAIQLWENHGSHTEPILPAELLALRDRLLLHFQKLDPAALCRCMDSWPNNMSMGHAELATFTKLFEDPNSLKNDMKALWDDGTVQTVLTKQIMRVEETSGFFLDCLDEVMVKNYVPSNEHILRAGVKTQGPMSECRIKMRGARGSSSGIVSRDWSIYEGRHVQQGVLTSSMNDMDSIIFLAPIWAFDQKLVDNPRINRLEDSFILWKDVVSSSVFERTNIILVLNKVDLMKRKLENGVRFADYVISYGDRPNDFESTSTYLRKHFASIHKQYSPSPRPLYYYFTTATDPGSAQRIIGRVRQMAASM